MKYENIDLSFYFIAEKKELYVKHAYQCNNIYIYYEICKNM